MPITTSPALQAKYANGGTFLFNAKLQVLDKNYNVIAEFTDEIINGRITVDKSRPSVRNFELSLENTSGKFTWGSNNLIWLDKKFKPYFGVWVNGAWEWVAQGVFPCSQPIATSKPGVNEAKFQGADKMAFLGKSENPITVQGGIADPAAPVILSSSGSGSAFGSTTVYVQYYFIDSQGNTTVGTSQASISVTAGQNVVAIISMPTNATAVGLCAGTASNPLLLGTISTTGTVTYSGGATSGLVPSISGQTLTVTISAPATASGAAAPTTNTCTGTDIATAIKSVLSGIEIMFNLDDTSSMQRVPYDMNWSAGTDYSKIIKDLADIITFEIFYDVNGYLRLRAPIDPNTTNPQMTLSSQASGFNLWAGADREMDDTNLANYIVVYGGSSQTSFVQYIIQDNDPNSPTSIQNIGKRVYLHNNGNPDPVITTTAMAQARAQYEYKNRLQIVEKQNFDIFPCPFMDIDDVYQITDPANGTSGKYQVVSFTLPIGVGSEMQKGYMWQVRSFAS